MSRKHASQEDWEQILTGKARGVAFMRGVMGAIPAGPRCKLCLAPFGRPGRGLVKLLGAGQSPLNRRLCKMCMRSLHKKPGGAEVEVSILFADVRGSTGLAERMSPGEFSQLIARFYGTAASVVDKHDGLVDKFVGDAAVALFIPGFAGDDHAAAAVAAGRQLLEETGDDGDEPWVQIGVGVHTGVSFVGTVGEGDAVDFTALGDTVNAAARIASLAGAGELLVSEMTAESAELDTAGLERRTLELRGREQTLDVWVATTKQPVAPAA
jgi:adenylate cyclase